MESKIQKKMQNQIEKLKKQIDGLKLKKDHYKGECYKRIEFYKKDINDLRDKHFEECEKYISQIEYFKNEIEIIKNNHYKEIDYYKNNHKSEIDKFNQLLGILKTGRISYQRNDDDGLVSGILFLKEIQQVEVHKTYVLIVTNSGNEIHLGKDYDYIEKIFLNKI